MSDVTVTFASSLYDRVLPLYTGEVKPDGVDLRFEAFFSPRPIFDRMASRQAFDVAEMSFSEVAAGFSAGETPFVAVPVFPSRAFRHGMIAVNTRSGIEAPRDLAGKRIGVPLYGMTAAVWIRGILAEHHGVNFDDVRWMQGAINGSGKHGDPVIQPLGRPVQIEQNVSGRTLSDLIADNELDAIIGTDLPASIRTSDHVRRLFPDFKRVEQAYLRTTGIFPIMHLLVIRKDVHERHPFLARSLYEACCKAKDLALTRLKYLGAHQNMVPWLPEAVDEIDDYFGGDPYPYGLEANRVTLERLLTYLHQQAITRRKLTPDELFVPVS